MKKKGKFTKQEYEKMYPSDAIPPRMYGTVKAHKPEKDYPMRIVVSTIGTPPHGISAYLVNVIQHSLDKNGTRLKNSTSFVEVAKNWRVSPTEVQVSYDVVNLYPSVPLKEATIVILDLLRQDPDLSKYTKLGITEIKMLIELCLSKCYFIWNDEIHMLKDSGPIGLSIMVVLAEGFLQVLEAKAIDEALHQQPPVIPLSFYRYVDDSHSTFESMNRADMFLDVLNKQHENIKYTIEKENEKKELNFLDIKIMNKGEGKYDFTIFRKEAITNVQVKPNSSHDPRILRGIFKGFLNRALSICSQNYLDQEIEFLVKTFEENGYSKEELLKMVQEVNYKGNADVSTNENSRESTTNGINNMEDQCYTITLPWIPGVSPKLRKAYRKAGYKVAFKSGRSIGDILTAKNKTKLPKNSRPGVYKIPCSCGITPYRGETKKRICTRVNEHIVNVEKGEWDKSAVAEHSKNCSGNILFDKAETVAVIDKTFERKVRETLEIQKHDCHIKDGGMNPDKGQNVTTKFWFPLLKFLKKSEKEDRCNRAKSNDVRV